MKIYLISRKDLFNTNTEQNANARDMESEREYEIKYKFYLMRCELKNINVSEHATYRIHN